jgi:hypothetical protein
VRLQPTAWRQTQGRHRQRRPRYLLLVTPTLDSNPTESQDTSPEVEIDFTPFKPRYDRPPKEPTSPEHRQNQATRAKQRGLGFDGEVLKETIIRKLFQVDKGHLAAPLVKCHTQQFIAVCDGCRRQTVYYNRCENFFCPICARRLAADRRRSVEWWTHQVRQPKHVVLTSRNTETLTPQRVKDFKAAWTKLRRRKFAKGWRGGFYSLEITNEGKGWHLHLHALVDAYWIDAGVGQDIAIVKVKDARGKEYLRELCKYIVDGNQLASWSGEDIATYIEAFTGQRCFGTFGALYSLRAEHRKFLDEIQADKPQCPCGCTTVRIFSPEEWEWHECKHGRPDRPLTLETRGATPQNLTPFLGFL